MDTPLHFICYGGCKGLSDTEGVCESADCPEFGQPLESCDCTDGHHYGAHDMLHDEEEDDA